jgi:hypothetical protein
MVLVPAGVLVLLLLAAIAVDGAGSYLAQRQLTDARAAATNDAPTAGLDNRAYYTTGSLQLDPATSAAVVCQSLAAQGDADLHHLALDLGVAGPVITVRGTADVREIFGRLIPRFGVRQVTAEVRADAQQDPTPSERIVSALTPIQC